MKTLASSLLVALTSLTFSFSVQADCAFPKAPATIPDGKTATEDEMKTAMLAFKAYNDEVTAFGTCLDEETKSKGAGSAQLMQLKTMQSKKINAAVDELQAKAKLFNEQVRAFKSR
jgi:signal recognition particle subunit SEC65